MTASIDYDASAFRTVLEREFTYLAGFRRNTHRYADRVALHDPETGRSWTYAELGAEVDRLAAGLAARGVRPGDQMSADSAVRGRYAPRHGESGELPGHGSATSEQPDLQPAPVRAPSALVAVRWVRVRPVVVLIRSSGMPAKLRLANDTEYGLSSAVFTCDVDRGIRFALRVDAGMTHVNDSPVNDGANTAFGGEKASGIGRFGGQPR